MPGRMQGSWAPPAPDGDNGLDYFDTPGDGSSNSVSRFASPSALSGGSGIVSPWGSFLGASASWAWSVANARATRTADNGLLAASRVWATPAWPLFYRQPAVSFGEPIPSVIYRLDAIVSMTPKNGIPVGAYLGIGENGADLAASAFNSGFQAEVDGAGLFATLRRRRVSGAGAVVTPIGGAISSLAPFVWSVEAMFGPVNRYRMFLAGALVFEEERSDALQIPFGTSISALKGPQWGRPARPATTEDGFWEYHAGRLTVRYV